MVGCVNFHKTRSLNRGIVFSVLINGERPIPNLGGSFQCTQDKKKGTTEGRLFAFCLIGFPLPPGRFTLLQMLPNPLLTAESAFPAFVSDGEPVVLQEPSISLGPNWDY